MASTSEHGGDAAAILHALGIAFDPDADLAPHTWYGVGGPAEALAHPADEGELALILRRCGEAGVAVRVLGEGANLLVAERGVPGVVVKLDAPIFREITIAHTTVSAGGGASLAKTIVATVRRGLAGLEGLAGIPATIGGAVRMNAGGRHGQIADRLRAVDVIDARGEMATLDPEDLAFGYRRSAVGSRIVVRAAFELTEAPPGEIRERMKSIFAYKKRTQPLADHSAGCAFKNPDPSVTDKSAGQLIDEAGLKGLSIGGARVSMHHANFLVADPGGRADDLIALIDAVRQRVLDRSGVSIEREVVVWPDDPGVLPEGGP